MSWPHTCVRTCLLSPRTNASSIGWKIATVSRVGVLQQIRTSRSPAKLLAPHVHSLLACLPRSWKTARTAELCQAGGNAYLLYCASSSHLFKAHAPLKLQQAPLRPANGGAYAPLEKIAAAVAEARGERPGSGLDWIPVPRPPAALENQSDPTGINVADANNRAGKTQLAVRCEEAAKVAQRVDEVFHNAKVRAIHVMLLISHSLACLLTRAVRMLVTTKSGRERVWSLCLILLDPL